jgi:hypothetical protein
MHVSVYTYMQADVISVHCTIHVTLVQHAHTQFLLSFLTLNRDYCMCESCIAVSPLVGANKPKAKLKVWLWLHQGSKVETTKHTDL